MFVTWLKKWLRGFDANVAPFVKGDYVRVHRGRDIPTAKFIGLDVNRMYIVAEVRNSVCSSRWLVRTHLDNEWRDSGWFEKVV